MRKPLVERGDEIEALEGVVRDLEEGRGGVLVIEGRSGIGKTAMLSALCEAVQATAAARVLSARGDELEQAYAFGVVRQLLEPVVAERRGALVGAAALAPAALGLAAGDDAGPASGGDAGFAALHALHWLVADLAAAGPVVLAIDDAQWADGASARLVSFLANRVDEQRVLIALTLRRGAGEQERRGLARLGARAETRVLELRPLSPEGTAGMLDVLMGAAPHPTFAAAVHAAVGGNPLLLDQLTVQLRREGIDPTAAASAALPGIDATSVARSVLVRLATLGSDEQAVARAVAVLGDAGRIPTVAAVARLEPERVGPALGLLQRAEVLEPEGSAYAHAIVRDAVLGDLTAAERGLAHERAATALLDDGVEPEQAALHLLLAPGTGRPESVAALRTAATTATARGAPQTALRFLRRALDEPVVARERAAVLAEAGHAALLAGDTQATPLLREAAELGGPDLRVVPLTELAHARLFAGDLDGATVAFDEAFAAADTDEEERLLGEAGLTSVLINVPGHAPDAMRRLAAHAELPGVTPGQRMILAVCAFASARAAAPATQTIGLARRALGDGLLVAEHRTDSLLLHELTWALQFADAFDEADRVLSEVIDDARRRGEVAGFALSGFGRGWLRLRRGDLAGARADAESSLATSRLYRSQATGPLATAIVVEALVDQGDHAAASAALADAGLDGEMPDGPFFNLALHARGRLRLATGDRAAGLADVLAAGERELGLGPTPAGMPWRATAVAALAATDRPRAAALAAEELALAERIGTPRALGVALHATGLAASGERSLELLRDAADALAAGDALLDRARARGALGAALRRAQRRTDARSHLRAALDDADRCGAHPLAARIREELTAAGGRPRRVRTTGRDALTPTELRIVRMAADGRANPEIAQDLFVTRKTVEYHLSNAYRKLDVHSRAELDGALGRESVLGAS